MEQKVKRSVYNHNTIMIHRYSKTSSRLYRGDHKIYAQTSNTRLFIFILKGKKNLTLIMTLSMLNYEFIYYLIIFDFAFLYKNGTIERGDAKQRMKMSFFDDVFYIIGVFFFKQNNIVCEKRILGATGFI